MLVSGSTRREPPDVVDDLAELDVLPPRPRTRADCKNGIRPCPYVGCSQHLLLDVDEHGTIYASTRKRINPGRRMAYSPGATPEGRALVEAWMESVAEAVVQAEETCTLDITDRYEETGVHFDLIGRLIRVGKQRAHQLAMRALRKLCAEHGWVFEDVVDVLRERGRL